MTELSPVDQRPRSASSSSTARTRIGSRAAHSILQKPGSSIDVTLVGTSVERTPDAERPLSSTDVTAVEISVDEPAHGPPSSQRQGFDVAYTNSLLDEGSSCIKLILVSRTLPDIETELQEFEKQTIEAEKKDLELYVSSEIYHRMKKGILQFNDRSLKDEIVDGLVKNASGMYVGSFLFRLYLPLTDLTGFAGSPVRLIIYASSLQTEINEMP